VKQTTLIAAILLLCGCAVGTASEEPTADIIARMGDRDITEADIRSLAGAALMNLEQQEYDIKSRALDQFLFDALVDEKAAAANVTRDQWLTENLAVPEPSEVDIQRVLTQYRSRLPEDENQAKLQVTQFLMQQAGQQAQADLLAKLKAEANITVFLEPPRVEPTETGHSPFRGAPDAPITIVEYTDFQCPYCERVQPVLESLRERYGDSIRHVFKNLPLPMHREADLAAQAGLCAFEQDSEGFWGLHDWMFANRQNLSIETITAQAEPNGLDAAALGACLQEGRYMEAVQQDAAEANAFGITGTPGFVVNGRMLKGAQPLEAFEAIIDDELQRAGLPVPEPAVPAEPEAPAAS
jgi:protein-disulfide isomerase